MKIKFTKIFIVISALLGIMLLASCDAVDEVMNELKNWQSSSNEDDSSHTNLIHGSYIFSGSNGEAFGTDENGNLIINGLPRVMYEVKIDEDGSYIIVDSDGNEFDGEYEITSHEDGKLAISITQSGHSTQISGLTPGVKFALLDPNYTCDENSHKWESMGECNGKICAVCGAREGNDEHDWRAATCTSPKVCRECGETSGDALGHDWKAATCTSPKVCRECGETSGDALGHDWRAATCTSPKVCRECGETVGEPLEHDWKAATCTSPWTCRECGEIVGDALGHDWKAATCTTPATCHRCGDTSGYAGGHDWHDATCVSPEACLNCGLTQGEAIDYMHDYVNGKCAHCGDRCSVGLEYSYNYQTKTYCVEGPGTCTDSCIIIPSVYNGKLVTTICENMISTADTHFRNNKNITEVIIPNTVTYIGYQAFYKCENLRRVVMPDSVTKIGSYAFAYCTNLTDIVLSKNLTVIPNYLFEGCKSLNSITVPASVTSIGACAFDNYYTKTIYFSGNKAVWNSIQKSSGWYSSISSITVYCNDGVITYSR